jgi:hypothetical protein
MRQHARRLTRTLLSAATATVPCTSCWAQSSAHWCQAQTGGGSLGCPRSQRLQHGPTHDNTLVLLRRDHLLPPIMCTWLWQQLSHGCWKRAFQAGGGPVMLPSPPTIRVISKYMACMHACMPAVLHMSCLKVPHQRPRTCLAVSSSHQAGRQQVGAAHGLMQAGQHQTTAAPGLAYGCLQDIHSTRDMWAE